MTRVASGHPSIWPDICVENRSAIVAVLGRLEAALAAMRDRVERGDREGLLAVLETARAARLNLPTRGVRPEELAEIRVPAADRPGSIAEVTTLASELGVSILDFEIAHSAEGDSGVFILLVELARADLLRGGLLARGYRPAATRPLT
jgi:prephenate dehydrogenase